jgi:hypothetical protein
MKYTVKILLNESPDHPFGQYGPGDPLIEGPTITVGAFDLAAVPEIAWEIGNKMAPDADGKDYDRKFRSVSVGDVILVTGGDVVGFGAMFACDIVGWKRL